jgi:hypothetical protein
VEFRDDAWACVPPVTRALVTPGVVMTTTPGEHRAALKSIGPGFSLGAAPKALLHWGCVYAHLGKMVATKRLNYKVTLGEQFAVPQASQDGFRFNQPCYGVVVMGLVDLDSGKVWAPAAAEKQEFSIDDWPNEYGLSDRHVVPLVVPLHLL